MQTPFAALQAMVNGSVLRTLSDATARFAGSAEQVPVLYEAEYQRVDVGAFGAASVQPAISVAVAALPVDDPAEVRLQVTLQRQIGDVVTLIGHFVVAEYHPDGTGMALLLLERTNEEAFP